MSPRSRLKVAVGRWERRLPVAIAVLVLVGLIASALVNVWIEEPAPDALPGVALGSQTLLVAERGVAFFAIWLLVMVVVAQAFRGRLPIEVSGRGVRYADLDVSQDELLDSRKAFEDLDREMEVLTDAVVALEQDLVEQADAVRRYAMGNEGHGH